MKHIATVALMLNLGVAGVYAQEKPVKMKFSGTNMPSTINLQPNTHTGNTQLAGKGTLGAFTFHELQDHGPSPEPPSGCSGPSFAVGAGAGVFRFQDGSLLIVTVMDGAGRINPAAMYATQTVTYQITGGTGRFTGASGDLTMTATIAPVLRDASGAPAFGTIMREFESTVFGVATGEEDQDEQQ